MTPTADLIRRAREGDFRVLDELATALEQCLETRTSCALSDAPDPVKAKFSRFALTPKQLEAALSIRGFIEDAGYSPTIAELAALLGISKISAYERILGLVRKGVLNKTDNASRGIKFAKGVL